MKCPICSNRNSIAIDMHSDGYAENIFECSACEAIWISSMEGIILINKKVA